jgi:hypothetical protein
MDTKHKEAHQKELDLLNAETYFVVPNRTDFLRTLANLTPQDITILQNLDFEVSADNNVANFKVLQNHLLSATGKILKLFGFSAFVSESIDLLEKRDYDQKLMLQTLGLPDQFRFPDLDLCTKNNAEEIQNLLKITQTNSEGTTQVSTLAKENAQKMLDFENQFSNLTVLTEGDNLRQVLYMAKAAKEYQEFKVKAEKDLLNLGVTFERQQEELKQLKELKYMTLEDINKKVEALQKRSEDAKVHITGTKKAPELLTMNPIEYRAFKENFLLHSKTHKWSEEISKQQLLLSVNSTIHSTLKMAVPNWDACALEDILKAWDKRICPDSVASLAVMHLSGLQQNLNEDTIAYLTRGHELYVRARLPDDTHQDPETDKAFVLKLIHGIKDKNLVNHLRRWDPKTISELREKINSEMAILNMDQTAQVSNQTISKIDGMDSNEKPKPPCALCQDDKHATIHCARLSETLAEIAKNIIPTPSYLRGRGGRGGNRGNNRGRGGNRGRGRGNGNNRGGNNKRPYQPNNYENGNSSDSPPKQVKAESESKN